MKNEAADAPITFEEFVMAVINRLKMSMLSRISEQNYVVGCCCVCHCVAVGF